MTPSTFKLALLPYALIAALAAAPLIASAALLAASAGSHSPALFRFSPAPVSPAPSAPTTPALDESDGATASFNWAGYAAQGEFGGVSGAWVVPAISAAASRGVAADATWVGVGGVGSTDLIQAGTQATVQNGAVEYRAWYELLPGYMTFVPLQVNAGDTVAASITASGGGRWQIAINDKTSGEHYTTTVAYDSSQSSVEWIEERPSTDAGTLLPLDNFDAVDWQSASAIGINGDSIAAGTAGAEPVTMYSEGGNELAAPSALGANGSFSITRQSTGNFSQQSAPAPAPSYIIIPHIVPPSSAPPAVTPSSSSVSESVTQSSAAGTHGEYSVYVNGKLVDHKSW